MTDRQAAEARERVSQWPAETEARTLILALADSVDALSVRLAQAEQERDQWRRHAQTSDKEVATLREAAGDPDYSPAYQDEYQRLWQRAEARLREYEEAIEIEYKCAHGHRWWMTTEPKHCPGCNTSSFSLVVAERTDSAPSSGGREAPDTKFSRLQKLNKDGTPGPWVLASDAGIVARHCETAEHDVRIPNTPFNGDEDEALIVECRNSLPAVLNLIEAAQRVTGESWFLIRSEGAAYDLAQAVAVFVSGQEEQP